jgi:hypothetical protein
MRLKVVLGIVIGAVALAVPVLAHHAHGNYEDNTVDMEGVVMEFHVLNPHAFLYFTTKNASGEEQVWALESDGNKDNFRKLVKEGTVKPGDVVKVRCHPLRDGSSGCLMGWYKGPDGVTRDFDNGGVPAKVDGF